MLHLVDLVYEDDAGLLHGLDGVSGHLGHIQPFLDLHVYDEWPGVFDLTTTKPDKSEDAYDTQ